MFKHVRHLLCASLLSISSVFASGIQDVLNEPMFANNEPTSFLWEINYQGENVGALFGTYHIGKKGTVLPSKAKEYLAKSNQLISENVIVFQTPADLAAQSLMVMGFFTSNQTLDERFTPKIATLLKDYLSSKGIPKAQQDKVTDMFLFMLIAIDIGPDYFAEYGMEGLITQFVMQNKTPETFKNIGLETILESLKLAQGALGDSLSKEIEQYFDYRDVVMVHSQKMFGCYAQNDVKCLLDEMLVMENVIPMTEQDKVQADAIMKKLGVDRNHNWMPNLLLNLKSDSSNYNFIAVGALHLFGKEGLIELLRKEGFELTPVLY
ncbi:MAG: TraB/GumN family protein [Wohlfahrtiimonas sp.]